MKALSYLLLFSIFICVSSSTFGQSKRPSDCLIPFDVHYLVGDWNGDGKDNIAIRRGKELIMDYNFTSLPEKVVEINLKPAFIPTEYLIGDWDGDGKDNIAVRKKRGKDMNLISMDFDFRGGAEKEFPYGNGFNEDEYLVGDWDGDGKDNIAVRKGRRVIMDYNFDGRGDRRQEYGDGNKEDEYLVGDWDGDGKDNLAIRRGNMIIMDYNFDGNGDKRIRFGHGNNEDQYLVGDWDGDGKDNIAVRRGNEIIMDTNFDSHRDMAFKFGNPPQGNRQGFRVEYSTEWEKCGKLYKPELVNLSEDTYIVNLNLYTLTGKKEKIEEFKDYKIGTYRTIPCNKIQDANYYCIQIVSKTIYKPIESEPSNNNPSSNQKFKNTLQKDYDEKCGRNDKYYVRNTDEQNSYEVTVEVKAKNTKIERTLQRVVTVSAGGRADVDCNYGISNPTDVYVTIKGERKLSNNSSAKLNNIIQRDYNEKCGRIDKYYVRNTDNQNSYKVTVEVRAKNTKIERTLQRVVTVSAGGRADVDCNYGISNPTNVYVTIKGEEKL